MYIYLSIFVFVMFCYLLAFKVSSRDARLVLHVILVGNLAFTYLGFTSEKYDNSGYIVPYLFYIIASFTGALLFSTNKIRKGLRPDWQELNKSFLPYLQVIGVSCLLVKLLTLVYPDFRIYDLFSPTYGYSHNLLFEKYQGGGGDRLASLMERYVTITYPFFAVLLYSLRKKPILFGSLFLLFHYITFVRFGYIGRHVMVGIMVFLFIYAVKEKLIKKSTAIYVFFAMALLSAPVLQYVFQYRSTGGVSPVTIDILASFSDLYHSEISGQQMMSFADSFSYRGDLSLFSMVVNAVLRPLIFLPNIEFPVLSQLYSEVYLGLKTSDSEFYIALPGAFGEGLMLLGKEGVWLFGLLIGAIGALINRLRTEVEWLDYWNIILMIEFVKAFRGGFQTHIIFIANSYVLLILISIVYLVFVRKGHNRRKNYRS